MKKTYTAFELKILAIIAMLLDHFVNLVLDIPNRNSVVVYIAVLMNMVGRLTMPIMCFFISEGYYHTRNLKKYIMRLFTFAVISQIPFYIFQHETPVKSFISFVKANIFQTNVIFTLFLGLCALIIAKSEKIPFAVKIVAVGALILASKYSDWKFYGVIWVLVFGLFRGDFNKQAMWFAVSVIIRCCLRNTSNPLSFLVQLCSLAAIPLLSGYNGERGKNAGLMFYIFYPLHLLIIGIIQRLV